MKTEPIFATIVTDSIDEPLVRCTTFRRTCFAAQIVLIATGLFACTQSSTDNASPPAASAPPATAAAPPPPPPVLPFDQAVLNAANTVFASAPAGSHLVVIDPLVDGVTGYVSKATESIQGRVTEVVRQQYPRFSIEKFSPESLNASPLVLVGTFTPINLQNQTQGTREAYRFCLVLGDLSSGKVVAKGVARAELTGVDTTPTNFYKDSPVWTVDPSTQAYISTCQATKVGDPISKEFLDGLLGASLITQASEAYNSGRYQDALELYTAAQKTPAGDQLKVYNGLYLTRWKLHQNTQAASAFGDLVSYGFKRNRLAVKFLFEPGSTRFYQDPQVSGQYELWLQQIAQQAAKSGNCVEVTGHTSPTGSAALNERLSFLRADYVKTRLQRDTPQLHDHLVTNGVGSSATLVGTGKDDASDALDRRVELKPIASCTTS
jgi:outer membrane protein OmpA-like peptidoglycan-associated protein